MKKDFTAIKDLAWEGLTPYSTEDEKSIRNNFKTQKKLKYNIKNLEVSTIAGEIIAMLKRM